jgi:hypothetical protein
VLDVLKHSDDTPGLVNNSTFAGNTDRSPTADPCTMFVVAVKYRGSERPDLAPGSVTIDALDLNHVSGCLSKSNLLGVEEVLANTEFVEEARGYQNKKLKSLCLKYFQTQPSNSTISRIKERISLVDNTITPKAFNGVQDWLDQFKLLNPGSVTDFKRDAKKTIVSCMVSHSVVLDVLKHSALKVFSLDAGFSHVKGWRGQIFVLEMTDGDYKNMPVAIGLYGVESAANYIDFIQQIMRIGDGEMGKLLNSPDVTIFTDRHASFKPALRQIVPLSYHMNDVRHILSNMNDNSAINRYGNTGMIWGIARAATEQLFRQKLQELRLVNVAAAEYLDGIPPESWAFYTVEVRHGVIYGKNSSNDVEGEMSRLNLFKVRHELPVQALHNYGMLISEIVGKRVVEAHNLQVNEHHKLTAYAEKHEGTDPTFQTV